MSAHGRPDGAAVGGLFRSAARPVGAILAASAELRAWPSARSWSRPLAAGVSIGMAVERSRLVDPRRTAGACPSIDRHTFEAAALPLARRLAGGDEHSRHGRIYPGRWRNSLPCRRTVGQTVRPWAGYSGPLRGLWARSSPRRQSCAPGRRRVPGAAQRARPSIDRRAGEAAALPTGATSRRWRRTFRTRAHISWP